MLKLLFTSVLLTYASWQDIKSREIEEKIWVIMGVGGVVATAYDAYAARDGFLFLKMVGIAAGAALFMLLLYKLGFFGFADVEALVALCTLYSFKQGSLLPFPISVFNNAILITAFLPILIFLRNIITIPNFSGIQDKFYKKIIILFLGYRMPLSSLDKNNFPLVREGKIRLFIPLEYDFPEFKRKAEEEGQKEVWITPGIPFILSLTGGFFMAYFWGDLILKLVFLLLR